MSCSSSPTGSSLPAAVPLRVEYQGGTIALRGMTSLPPEAPSGGHWDDRDNCFRFEAMAYRDIVLWLHSSKLNFVDQASLYERLSLANRIEQTPFPYQAAAVDAWLRGSKRGTIVLPTGAGKSYVAALAIEKAARSVLVVVPTLDLVSQWYDQLRASFDIDVGIIGGGYNELGPLCVTTYDSAHLHAERLGNRFGMLVYDECHHLPGESYSVSARASIAPFRLGLTATLERSDGRHQMLVDLIGPTVYRREVSELSGEYLSEYEAVRLRVSLSPQEREEYDAQRGVYLEFVRSHDLRLGSESGWRQFLIETSRSPAGRRAFLAFRRQRELATCASGKMDLLEVLLHRHRTDRALVFTQDNATAYSIARRFLVPVITHQTKTKERSRILDGLKSGVYTAVVTSKVLNEGVDVPDANVAIVLSGSGSVREHVQRLGRVLRRRENKKAVLYEVVSESTSEEWVSERRRDHDAYR